jgi:hypothetical protein
MASDNPSMQRAYASIGMTGGVDTPPPAPEKTGYEAEAQGIELFDEAGNPAKLTAKDRALLQQFRPKDFALYTSAMDEGRESVKEDIAVKKEGRQTAGDALSYALKVKDSITKENKEDLSVIRSTGRALDAIKGKAFGKSGVIDYNIVKAALRAFAAEAVNEGDIANIQNRGQGSALATIKRMAGIAQPLTDEQVKDALGSLVDIYNSAYSNAGKAVENAKQADYEYKKSVNRELDNILGGRKQSYSVSEIMKKRDETSKKSESPMDRIKRLKGLK